MLGYRHGVPVKGLSTDAALDYILDAFDRRAELRREVELGLRTVEEKLDVYRAELKGFLGRAAARETT